jgi:hypothetical protein
MAGGTKSVAIEATNWLNERTGHIHIAARDGFISTVSNDPASKRYHPNLHRKLAEHLSGAGAPSPA